IEKGDRTEQETISIQRQFDWSKRASCHWRIAVAVADWQRSAIYGFGDASTLLGNKRGAATTECSATGESESVGGAPDTTGSSHCGGTICDVNSTTHSASREGSYISANAIRVSVHERANEDLRPDNEPRSLLRECVGHAAWSLSEVSFGRDWLTLVRVYRSANRFSHHRHGSRGLCSGSKRTCEESKSRRKLIKRDFGKRLHSSDSGSA